jgi:hypothetical protein
MPDVGPFQVTVHDRGSKQWVKVLCAIGLYDFEVWRGRLAHSDLWTLLHTLETGVPFASPFHFRCKVPVPFSAVHPNQGPDRRFLVLSRDGVEALVLYCVSSSIPQALHLALVQAWSYDPDAAGGIDEGHRQELRRDPEGPAGAEPGQGGQHGQGPGPDLDQAPRQPGRRHGREVTPPERKPKNRYTMGTIPAEIRDEVLAEMERPEVARIHPKRLRIYQATVNVKRRHGGSLHSLGVPRTKGVKRFVRGKTAAR